QKEEIIMSTSLLYHTQRIIDYQHVSFKFKVSQTIWKLKRKLFSLRCKNCGSKDVTERKINLDGLFGALFFIKNFLTLLEYNLSLI
ncbi:MAG: hypothetical protein V1872_14355, partial [bacterium]